ncbi:MAG: TolB family protein [Pyrinomonadaceae bacterium]
MRPQMNRLMFGCVVTLVLSATARAQTQTPSPSPAATPPSSDIFIVEVKTKFDRKQRTDELKFGEPKKITDFVGYNNQPFFMPDGHSILYTSIRNKQADIYRYDSRAGTTTQVTNTSESEYSPTLMPDRKNMSVVRVESDGTQRLWKFPLEGGPPSLILENIKPVGYHLWIDDYTLALFILGATGKPNFLEVLDMRTQKSQFVTDNPGRILRKVPNQSKFSFVHKIDDANWQIKAFDLRTHTVASLIATLPGAEDYAWLPDGKLLMAKDSKLFAVIPLVGDKWTQVADFSKAGIKRITRIAVNGNGSRIAIVAQ